MRRCQNKKPFLRKTVTRIRKKGQRKEKDEAFYTAPRERWSEIPKTLCLPPIAREQKTTARKQRHGNGTRRSSPPTHIYFIKVLIGKSMRENVEAPRINHKKRTTVPKPLSFFAAAGSAPRPLRMMKEIIKRDDLPCEVYRRSWR